MTTAGRAYGPYFDTLFSLEGQVALITGGARGLGLEMACGLAAAGATILLAGRDSGRLAPAVDRIRAEGGSAFPLVFDMDDEAAMRTTLDNSLSMHGRLDILIANAGVRDRTGFSGLTRDGFMRLLGTNLVATADLCQLCAKAMVAGGRGGRIIAVGSVISSLAIAGDPAYLASKAGLTGIVRALAAEFGPHGITANEIAPGSFATEYNAALAADPQASAMVRARTLVERWGEPREIAAAALFLASPGAAYVTGHRLLVDGGMSVKA